LYVSFFNIITHSDSPYYVSIMLLLFIRVINQSQWI